MVFLRVDKCNISYFWVIDGAKYHHQRHIPASLKHKFGLSIGYLKFKLASSIGLKAPRANDDYLTRWSNLLPCCWKFRFLLSLQDLLLTQYSYGTGFKPKNVFGCDSISRFWLHIQIRLRNDLIPAFNFCHLVF